MKMISSEVFVEKLKNKSYEELIYERDMLIASIQNFERGCYNSVENKSFFEMRYQTKLEYLSALCLLISEKFKNKMQEGVV